MTGLESRVSRAYQSGDPIELAAALLERADTRVKEGQVEAALADLDEAVSIHHQLGHVYDEARCLQLSAELCRLIAKPLEARERAQKALALAGRNNPVVVGAYAELGEAALAQGDFSAAVGAYSQAIENGSAAGLKPAGQAALLRRRATAQAGGGSADLSGEDLAQAYQLYQMSGDLSSARQVLVETAAAWLHAGDLIKTGHFWQKAYQAATEAEDHARLSDLHLLKAAQAVNENEIEAALRSCQDARREALRATAPVQYISAVVTISQLFERIGNRDGAYEALAVGWVTLGDLLGRDAAKATFEPKLVEMRKRWGDRIFVGIKSAYEARRREQIGGSSEA